ncbi:mannose-P-dolichol utilization defect 1 protein [Trichinella spiralis]|uniref:mannose-P-dolichol utilization defect 1 protein n=1 Tax=Trichinella spiralis TaxID=6334 RepID=UPI0001EFCEFB|nr:mannose-P-dolichol utilization defect 1 protein [Trichinella spiralis]
MDSIVLMSKLGRNQVLLVCKSPLGKFYLVGNKNCKFSTLPLTALIIDVPSLCVYFQCAVCLLVTAACNNKTFSEINLGSFCSILIFRVASDLEQLGVPLSLVEKLKTNTCLVSVWPAGHHCDRAVFL